MAVRLRVSLLPVFVEVTIIVIVFHIIIILYDVQYITNT